MANQSAIKKNFLYAPEHVLDCPYRTELRLGFSDFDLFNHVNNVVYFRWFESARVGLLLDAFGLSDPSRLSVTLAQIECQYLQPIKWGDTLTLGAAVSRIGTKSFELTYLISDSTKGLCAIGTSTQVFFDHLSQATLNIPEHHKSALILKKSNFELE